MKVLVACEESQIVCIEFRHRGHEAYSCDLQPCSGGHPEWHIQDDVINVMTRNYWDLIIAHPPCTRLANSGVRWLAERNLWNELEAACQFFNTFQKEGEKGVMVAIENPRPHKYATAKIGRSSQIIHPWQFGHGETKETHLWLYNLPPLMSTEIVTGREQRIHKMAPGKDRAKIRSKTFPGIARAMADQWG